MASLRAADDCADEPVELPIFDVTWLAISNDFKLMHVKVLSPAELAMAPEVQVSMFSGRVVSSPDQ